MVSEKQPLQQLLDNLLFPKIFQSFHMAVQPGKLAIALLALAVVCLVGYLMDFSQSVVVTEDGTVSELAVYLDQTNPAGAVSGFRTDLYEKGLRTGVFFTLRNFGSAKFHAVLRELFELNLASVADHISEYFKAMQWAIRYHYIYCVIFAVIKLGVFSIAGGAICRITALQFARGEKPGLIEALRFSTKRFTSFFFAPLVPLILIACVGLPVFLLGLLGNIPYAGELIIGVLTLLLLMAGAVIAIALIGAVAGFNLMFPAVAYDGLDSLDVIGRSFSYIFNRPWSMGFYTILATVYGAVCYFFVRLFAFLLLSVTHTILRTSIWVDNGNAVNKLEAIWPEPQFMNLFGGDASATAGATESVAALLVYLFLWVVVGSVVSVIITFYFSANTIIYSLMRHKVDNAMLNDVYSDFEDVGIAPAEAEDEESPES